MARILIIEDEKSIRSVLKNIITDENKLYQVEEAENGKNGLNLIKNNDYDLVFCDIKMPGIDGIEVLEKIHSLSAELPVVMISGHGDVDTAVECMHKGAFDYISKPPDLNRLLNTLRNAVEKKTLITENKKLRKKIEKKYDIIGSSKKTQNILEMIERVAPTDARVLITGENGTGKELVAHWLHKKSQRHSNPFIEVNCAAIPTELIESELFGHEKGAFTSAIKQKKGKFEMANQGTLFLDEIGDMSASTQAKVLRALQENKISRVGDEKQIPINVRIIAATNKNLKKEIKEGNFREDLFHRLSVILINIPSLGERKEDIPELIKHFINLFAKEEGIKPKKISSKAIKLLQDYNWTGNIRELRNVIERLIILGENPIDKNDVKKYVNK